MKKRKNDDQKVLTIKTSGAKGLSNRRTKNVKVYSKIKISTDKNEDLKEMETNKDAKPKDPEWDFEEEL